MEFCAHLPSSLAFQAIAPSWLFFGGVKIRKNHIENGTRGVWRSGSPRSRCSGASTSPRRVRTSSQPSSPLTLTSHGGRIHRPGSHRLPPQSPGFTDTALLGVWKLTSKKFFNNKLINYIARCSPRILWVRNAVNLDTFFLVLCQLQALSVLSLHVCYTQQGESGV